MRTDVRGVFFQRNVWVMCMSMALFGVTFGLWMPFFPLYVSALGATPADMGFIFTIFFLSHFALQMLGGFLADRFGRKKVIVYASLARIFPPVIYYFAETWHHVILGILVNSIGSLYIPALQALLAESLPEKRRGLGFGALWASFSIFEVVMPPIGGWMLDSMGVIEGIRFALIVCFITTLIAVTIRILFLEETLDTRRPGPVLNIREIAALLSGIKGRLLVALIVSCLTTFAFTVANPFFVLYAVEILSLSKTQWGILASTFGIASSLFQMPGGALSDKIGRRTCIILARAVLPLRPLGFLFLGSFERILPVFLICGVAAGMNMPAWSALLADITTARTRGRVFGLFGTLSGIITSPASLIGGWAWTLVGHFSPFVISIVIELAGLVTFLAFFKPEKATGRPPK